MKKKIIIAILFFISIFVFLLFSISDTSKDNNIHINRKTTVKLVAVGDSLTQGVGDSTKKGGYVYQIKNMLQNNTNSRVITKNYGISGETSKQIDKRVENNRTLQKDLAQANIITITAGGNDLMHILRNKGLNLTTKDVIDGNNKFELNLNQLLNDVRKYNNKAPIYLISIYNPFGVTLKNVKYMNTAVHNWNKATNENLQETYDVHFVNIDKILSNPREKKIDSEGDEQNPYLYKKDNFHPNNKGYKLITNQLYKQIIKNQSN